MNTFGVKIMQLPSAYGLPMPAYPDEKSPGMELCAAISTNLVSLRENERVNIPTGLIIDLPTGLEAQVRSIPENVENEGWGVLLGPMTIGADKNKEIVVTLYNTSDKTIMIKRGTKIALLVVAPVAKVQWQELENA
ncbi:MAG: dUTP diphosphatase [Alphaproteobacteria bacterium]|nr:dUTP diphosphatase [Alphaproteobacteria bacterium]